jgi:hypothetical protein
MKQSPPTPRNTSPGPRQCYDPQSCDSPGIPSHDTFRRVFMLIDPDAFETGFATWVGALTAGFEREVVAIDGKTIRRSFDHGREQSPLHVVSAWASEQGLVLGQRCVDGKSNEITAVPELLDQLALQNSIVTLDAMGGAVASGPASLRLRSARHCGPASAWPSLRGAQRRGRQGGSQRRNGRRKRPLAWHRPFVRRAAAPRAPAPPACPRPARARVRGGPASAQCTGRPAWRAAPSCGPASSRFGPASAWTVRR